MPLTYLIWHSRVLYDRLQKGFNEHTESMNHLRRHEAFSLSLSISLSLSLSLSLCYSAPSVDSRAIIHLQIIRVRVLRACAFLVVDSLNEQRVSLIVS